MKYLLGIDNYYMTVDLIANEDKEITLPNGKHAIVSPGKILKKPTKEHPGAGLVEMQFVESRNFTSEICAIAKCVIEKLS